MSQGDKYRLGQLLLWAGQWQESVDVDSRYVGLGFRGVCLDSREVKPGDVFAAVPGSACDGRAFIDQAHQRGASAVLTDRRPLEQMPHLPVLQADNPHRLLAKLAAKLAGAQPGHQLMVTGTNGKSSVVDFVRQLWTMQGHRAASIGTLGVIGTRPGSAGGLTSPDAISLADTLATLAKEGVDYAALEASSHGLDQYRLDGTHPEIGVFTGLGRDHLDYHHSLEAYLKAKLGLFERVLSEGGQALVAAGSTGSETVTEVCRGRGIPVCDYGIGQGTLRAGNLARRPEGLTWTLVDQRLDTTFEATISLDLIGDFQCANALAAYGAAVAMGGRQAEIAAMLSRLQPVAGRLQRVGQTPKGAWVYVDYAHSPDALETVLKAVRGHFGGSVWLGFGCGGDRDRGKRPVMGEVAARMADRVVVCDDNPRGEDSALIRQAVLAGAPTAKEIGDRAEAIGYLCASADAGDLVLIAGKGHEQGQIVGDRVLPFDDVAEARRHVRESDR